MNRQILYNPYAPFIIIIAAVCGIYSNTLFNGFVYDDNYQVLQNQWITDVQHIPDILSSSVTEFDPLRGASNTYRPMMHMLYMIEHFAFGYKPWGWHLINVLFHALNAGMVFLITSRLFATSELLCGSRGIDDHKSSFIFSHTGTIALFSALLFALHPVNTEVVNWVSCIPELSFTLFSLVAFYLYMKPQELGQENPTKAALISVRHGVSVLFFLLALLSKETALTLPLMILVYDYVQSGKNRHIWMRKFKIYVPYGVAMLIYILLRLYSLKGVIPRPSFHSYLSPVQNLIDIFPLIAGYMKTLLLPIHLSHFHPFHPVYSISDMRFVTSLFIDSMMVYIFYRAGRKNRLFFIATILIIVPLMPVLFVPALGRSVFAERYLYLPSAGFALLLTLSVAYVSQHLFRKKAAMIWGFLTAAVCVSGLYSAGVFTRSFDWKDDYTLWQSTLRQYPESYFAHYKLGKFSLQNEAFDDAIEALYRSINLNVSEPHTDLSVLELAQMQLDKAHARSRMRDEKILHYKKILGAFPDRHDLYLKLGTLLIKKGSIDEAILWYRKALQVSDSTTKDIDIYTNLGIAYQEKRLLKDAIESYQKVLSIDPENDFAAKRLKELQ